MLDSHSIGVLSIIIVVLSGIIAIIKAVISGQEEDEHRGQ